MYTRYFAELSGGEIFLPRKFSDLWYQNACALADSMYDEYGFQHYCASLSPPSLSQRTKATIKIFSEPMPNSNERSIQLMGTVDQIMECVHRFLDDISKVRLCVGRLSMQG